MIILQRIYLGLQYFLKLGVLKVLFADEYSTYFKASKRLILPNAFLIYAALGLAIALQLVIVASSYYNLNTYYYLLYNVNFNLFMVVLAFIIIGFYFTGRILQLALVPVNDSIQQELLINYYNPIKDKFTYQGTVEQFCTLLTRYQKNPQLLPNLANQMLQDQKELAELDQHKEHK